jgi:hypothetical protein
MMILNRVSGEQNFTLIQTRSAVRKCKGEARKLNLG